MNSDIMNFEILVIEVDNIIYKSMAEKVLIPGLGGQICILPNHSPISIVLQPGTLVITEGANLKEIPIKSGVAYFNNNVFEVLISSKVY